VVSDIKIDLDYRMAYGHRAWRNVSLLEIACRVFVLKNKYVTIVWWDDIIPNFHT
jgi:hypothetical protein